MTENTKNLKNESGQIKKKATRPTKSNFQTTDFTIKPITLEIVRAVGLDVQSVSIGEASGRWQLLFIYPKDNTSGCTQEAIDFSNLRSEFDKLSIDLIGVSKDSVKSHKKFIETHSLKIDLISDPDCILISELGSWVEKSLYGRAYLGADRSSFIINPEGKIVGAWRNLKVAGHADNALETIADLSSTL